MFGGIAAFIAIRMARKPYFTLQAMKIEMFAAGGSGLVNFVYLLALFATRGAFFDVYITKSLVFAVGGACIHRVFQIRKERKRVISHFRRPTKIVGVVADEEGK